MKKILCTLLAVCVMASVTVVSAENGVSGTFEGAARGFHDQVKVAVTLDNGVITDVQVVEHQESDGVSDWAISETPKRIMEAQSWNIDTVSGATYSSNAVKYAAKAAIDASGAQGLGEKVTAAKGEDEELTVDVVIVGGGIAGLTSAIEAKRAGASVLVLEKLGRLGGSSVTSGGYVYGTGSQMNKEYDNDPEDMVNYYIERGHGNIDVDMVRFWAEHSGETVDWLIDEMGLEFGKGVVATGTSPALRSHLTANGGAGIMKPIYEKVAAEAVPYRLETPVTDILVEEGKVAGVVAEHNGAKVTVHAGTVIVACGGFDASKEMKALYAPDAENIACMSSCGNTGDYIAWGEKLGASMVFKGGVMGMHSTNPSYTLTGGINLLSFLPTLGVTEKGERFQNESNDYPIFYTKMLESGSETAWWIFDSASPFVALCEAALPHYGVKADTIEALAEAAKMDVDTFKATVARYNELGEKGVDEDFGRASIAPLAAEGPYYAIKVVRATVAGFGGFKINTQAQVLDQNDQAIPGLYAAGECASGQFFDKEYP
ncbi:MAG: FAD-dependent oxidoreductase, partial [Clostridia bacterium]|nr:FAD-dependent oxidoreductase [Clostridia bacterium]